MIKFLKKILFKVFGLSAYLKIVSTSYIRLIKLGYGKKKYPELYKLKDIIKPGFTCIDIGANMGYYSVFLSKYAGENGKVYAVEPVPLFCEIWKKNTKKYKNLKLLNFALGNNKTVVEMGMPLFDGELHHGMTRVISDKNLDYYKKFEVEMKIPDKVFADIAKIDFIKIDVEGYEHLVFENMIQTIEKHKPLIQSELSGKENRQSVISILKSLGYKTCILKNNNIVEASSKDIENHEQDFYFKPIKNEES